MVILLPKDETTTKFKVDISELKANIQEANRQIRLANSEFKAATSGMDKWSESADGISAKLKQLNDVLDGEKKKLKSLEDQYELVVKEQGENSRGAEELRIKINNQKAAIGETEKQIRNYNDRLTEMQSETNKTETASDKLKDTIKKQQSDLDTLKEKYKNLVLEQGAESDAAKNAANDISALSSELKDNKAKLESTEKAADELDNSIEEVGNEADKTTKGGLNAFSVALGNLISGVVKQAIGKLKDLAAESINVGMSFDSSMSKVKAISGATGEEYEQLRQKAKDMGATTKFSATEASEAFEYMGMAGWNSQQMISGIDGILNLAAASGADLATTSDIVTDALTAMGYKAEDAGHLADVMAAASTNANTNVELMGETFKYAAPLAGALGYNMEDTAVAIGLMANAGVKGTQAGTALRGILTRLVSPTKDSMEAMSALGITVEKTNSDGTNSMKSLGETMNDLRQIFGKIRMPVDEFNEKLKSLESRQADLDKQFEAGEITQKAYEKQTGEIVTEQAELMKRAYGAEGALKGQYAAMLAGKNALSGLLAIVNASDEDFTKLTDAIYNSEGAAQTMADTMINNLGGDMTIMKSNLESLQIAFYEKLEPALRSGVDYLSKIIDGAKFVVNNSEAFGEAIRTIGDILLPIITAVGAFILSIKWGSIVAAVTGGLTTLGGAFTGFWAVLTTNPIGIVIALIAGLVTAFMVLWRRCDWFREGWISFWKIIQNTAKKAANAIKKFFSDALTEIKKVWNGAKSFFSSVWDGIKAVFSTVVTWWSNLFTKAFMAVRDAWNGAVDFFSGIRKGIENAFAIIDSWLEDKFITAFDLIRNAWSGVTAFFKELWEAVKKVFEPVSEFFKFTFELAWTAVKFIWDSAAAFFEIVWKLIKIAFEPAAEWFGEKFTDAWNRVKETWDTVSEFFGEVWNAIKSVFSNVGIWFRNKFADARNKINEKFSDIGAWFSDRYDDIKEAFSNIGTWFRNKFSDARNKTKETFSDIGDWFSDRYEDVKVSFNSVSGWFGDKFKEARSNANDAFSNVGVWFASRREDIYRAFSPIADRLRDIFTDAWERIKEPFNGVSSFFDGVMETVRNAFSPIGTTVGDAIGEAFKNAINAVIETVENTLNFIPNKVNPMLQTITDWTGETFPLMPTVDFPRLAKGGVLKKGQIGLLEGSGAEAVVPLEKNTQWLDEIAKRISIQSGMPGGYAYAGAQPVQNVVNNFYQTNNSPKPLSRLEIYRQSKNLLKMKG